MTWQIAVAPRFKQHVINSELIISSSLLVLAQNKHEWTPEAICFNHEKTSMHTISQFRSQSPPTLSCLVCLWDKREDSALWLIRSPVNQIPGKGGAWGNIERTEYLKSIMWVGLRQCWRFNGLLVKCLGSWWIQAQEMFTFYSNTSIILPFDKKKNAFSCLEKAEVVMDP